MAGAPWEKSAACPWRQVLPPPPGLKTAAKAPKPGRCRRARGTNVNDQTLLATDYLNHFNEVV
ncbi:MAG: hypothetical protein FJX42_11365, partial [Alphaproteobacteria bacterium]|nr:hypothetical protein [Alphaproteobacteria bacterium]